MNAFLFRSGAVAQGLVLALPNINVDKRALPATVDPGLADPANAVALDKEKPVRRPTDAQLYELRIEVLPTDLAAHPGLQIVISGVSPQFVLLDTSGRALSSTTLDVQAEFAKNTKSTPNTLPYLLEAQTFPASALMPDSLPSLKVDFTDQGNSVASATLPLFAGDLILLGDGETPSRLYIADTDDNQPTVVEVKAALSGTLPVVTVPSVVCSGDTWLQDQFQLALTFDANRQAQTVAVHLPRMRSNGQLSGSNDNLATFVDNHFPSNDMGVFKDLWNTTIPIAVASAQGGSASLSLSVRDSNSVLTSLLPVARLWEQIQLTISALKSVSPPALPLKFFDKRRRLASELGVLKATPAGNPDQKRDKDALTFSMDQKLADINKNLPLVSGSMRMSIKGQTVEVSENAVNDLFDRLVEIHGSANYGGNIEVVPPDANAPLGTVITGDIADRDLQTLLTRLTKQSSAPQSWVSVGTSWLSVGHIDEIATFVAPNGAGVGSPLVLRASPKLALALLDAAKKAQDAGTLVTRLFRGKNWRHEETAATPDPLYPPHAYRFLYAQYGKYDLSDFRTPVAYIPLGPSAYFDDRKYLFYLGGNASPRDYAASMSVTEILDTCRETNRTIDDVFLAGKANAAKQADYPLLNDFSASAFSDTIKSGLDAVVAKTFSTATLVPFPVLFDRVDLFSLTTTEAITPDLVNLQQAGRVLLVPRPYGPRLRPGDALAIMKPMVDDNTVSNLPSSVRQNVLKLLTTQNLHARNLDVTTHWTSPGKSYLRWDPASLNKKGYADAVETLDVVAETFRDGFDEFPNPARDYTKGDTPYVQTARNYFGQNLPIVKQRIAKANPSTFSASGYVNGNGWVRIIIPENTVDLFEVYTQLVLEALGFTVKWVDSWFYHTHAGGLHCATNVLRKIDPGTFSKRMTALQKMQ